MAVVARTREGGGSRGGRLETRERQARRSDGEALQTAKKRRGPDPSVSRLGTV